MKTIEDYKNDLDKVNGQIKPLEAKRTRILNRIRKMKDNAATVFHATLPDTIEEYTDDQIKWLLYHWHDEASADYQKKNILFHKMGLFTTGINGGSELETVRQYRFLATETNFLKFMGLYQLVKPHLKDFPSKVEPEKNVIVLDTHTNAFGWDYCHDGVNVEIDKVNDKARFIKSHSKYDNKSDWVSFEKLHEILNEYTDYELDED